MAIVLKRFKRQTVSMIRHNVPDLGSIFESRLYVFLTEPFCVMLLTISTTFIDLLQQFAFE